jgi:hypothetical protein
VHSAWIESLGKFALRLLKRTENVNRLDENMEIAVLIQQKIRMKTNKRGRPSFVTLLVTKMRVFSRNESAFKSLIESCNQCDANSNVTMAYTFEDQLDETNESERASEITDVHTNTNDEEDVSTSLLRLNQENFDPDSNDEPEWLQHLAA